MSEPLVSFIVANHNYSEYLESCILSAVNQTYRNILIVIVDDASTDNSKEIIEKLAKTDSRIIPIYNEKCVGPSISRNIAIQRVWDKTDYFQILDADDEAVPKKAEIFLSKITLSPMIGVIYGDYTILNVETGNILREYKEPYSLAGLSRSCIVHSASMISKQALEATVERGEDGNISFYDKRLHGPATQTFIASCEDFDLWLRISEKFLFVHVPKPLSLVRVHKNNASQIEKVNKVWPKNIELIQAKAEKRKLVNNKG